MSDQTESPGPAWPKKHAWRQIPREMPPKRPVAERICDFDEIYGFYDEAGAQAQASRCINCPDPPCAQTCPLGNRIPVWLALVADGRFLEAAEVSRTTSNMPEIFGILSTELKGYTDRLEQVWKTDLAAVNKELARLKLPPLDPRCPKAEGCGVM